MTIYLHTWIYDWNMYHFQPIELKSHYIWSKQVYTIQFKRRNLSKFQRYSGKELFKNVTGFGGRMVTKISDKKWHREEELHTNSDITTKKNYGGAV